MCFDPVSLGLMAAGTAASVAGNSMSRRDNQDAILRDTRARNAVLKSTLGKLGGFQDENLATIQDTVSGFDPGPQAAAYDSAVGGRNAAIDSTVSAPDAPPDLKTPKIVKDVIAAKMLDAFKYSKDVAKAKAKASAYGDVTQGNARGISDASGTIDMTNNFARGTASMLGDQQAFASTGAYKAPSAIGPTLSSIGNLMAGLGGSGRAGGMSMPGMPSIPGFNPIRGVTGVG